MGRSLRIDFAQRKEDRPANADGGMREVSMGAGNSYHIPLFFHRQISTLSSWTITKCITHFILYVYNSIILKRSPRSSGGDNQHSIFLGNLAWDVTPELVMDMVNDVLGPGLYNNVRLAIDRETGRQRGFGHIDFKGMKHDIIWSRIFLNCSSVIISPVLYYPNCIKAISEWCLYRSLFIRSNSLRI